MANFLCLIAAEVALLVNGGLVKPETLNYSFNSQEWSRIEIYM